MTLTIEQAAKNKILKDAGINATSPIYSSKVTNNDTFTDTCYIASDFRFDIFEYWNKQHPVIHSWLLLSSVSICFLSAIFFMIP